MPVSLQRFLRHPPGTRLTMRLMLSEPILKLALSYFEGLSDWIEAVKEGALHIEHVDDDQCALRFDSPQHCGRIDISREDQGGLHLRAACQNNLSWERRGLVAMLGGKHDVYLARPGNGGNQALFKLRYDTGEIQVSILSAAFLDRIAPALRALVPGELRIGVLTPMC